MMSLLYEESTLFGNPLVRGFEAHGVRVELISKADADALVKAGHYSGAVCWASNWHFGVFWNGDLIGALQYGPLMNPASAAKIVAGSDGADCLELNRMWLADKKPPNCATLAISRSLKVLRARKPRLAWVQSFADERCGKFGGVYQAASFLYCGSHLGVFYELDGEWFHKSAIGRRDSRGWGIGPKLSRFNRDKDRAVRHEFRQFRYVRPLTKAARTRLMLPVLPYPKPEVLACAA